LLPGSQDRVADATVESAGVGEVFEVEAVGEETGDGGRAGTSDSADVVGGITDQGSSVAPLGRGDLEPLGDLFGGDDALAGGTGGIEHVNSVAEELVEVAVP
jgi:hypothetical protein